MGLVECQQRIGSAEFSWWQAYYSIEPFGEERADHRAAIIAHTIATIYAKKGHRFSLDDFIPKYRKQIAGPQSVTAQKAAFGAYARATQLASAARKKRKGKRNGDE